MRSSVLGGARTAALAGREPCQLQRLVRWPWIQFELHPPAALVISTTVPKKQKWQVFRS
jgi:hypothetical protein